MNEEKNKASVHVLIVMPDREIFRGSVNMVVVPGVEGDIGVLPGHAPLMTSLRQHASVVVFNSQLKPTIGFFVSRGFVEIANNQVMVYGRFVEQYNQRTVDDIQQQLSNLKDKKSALNKDLQELIVAASSLPYGLTIGAKSLP